MKFFLLLFFVVAAGCACALLLAVLRARDRRLLVAAARTAYSDAPDGIGISVLCSGVTDPAQLENLLSSEYSRYEVVVVLDSRRQAAEFAALIARYRMIRVEWTFAGELEVTGVRALGRSRKRCFRRLVLVDRVFDGAAGDLDAAAAVATYDYLLPVGRGQCLLPGTVERLVAELGSEPPGSLDLVRSHLGEPAALLSREALVAAGGFGMRPLRGIPRSPAADSLGTAAGAVRSPTEPAPEVAFPAGAAAGRGVRPVGRRRTVDGCGRRRDRRAGVGCRRMRLAGRLRRGLVRTPTFHTIRRISVTIKDPKYFTIS